MIEMTNSYKETKYTTSKSSTNQFFIDGLLSLCRILKDLKESDVKSLKHDEIVIILSNLLVERDKLEKHWPKTNYSELGREKEVTLKPNSSPKRNMGKSANLRKNSVSSPTAITESNNKGECNRLNFFQDGGKNFMPVSEKKKHTKKVKISLKIKHYNSIKSDSYQCDICGKTLKRKESLYHHTRGLHREEKPYSCIKCKRTFSYNHSYKLHMQRHLGQRPFVCEICKKSYLTSYHLKVHKAAQHEKKKHECGVCGASFAYKSTLNSHMLSHSESKPFECVICKRGFITKYSFQAHWLSHSKEKNFPCLICGKSYKSKQSRSVHIKNSHCVKEPKYCCKTCGKSFSLKSSFTSHSLVHKDDRPYVCNFCNKRFKSLGSLKTHARTHTDQKIFSCQECGKSFKTKVCLVAHEKRHKNEKKSLCSICGSSFPDAGGLAKHMKSIHIPKKRFICSICGKTSTRADNLRTHIQSHRNEVSTDTHVNNYMKTEIVTEAELAQIKSKEKLLTSVTWSILKSDKTTISRPDKSRANKDLSTCTTESYYKATSSKSDQNSFQNFNYVTQSNQQLYSENDDSRKYRFFPVEDYSKHYFNLSNGSMCSQRSSQDTPNIFQMPTLQQTNIPNGGLSSVHRYTDAYGRRNFIPSNTDIEESINTDTARVCENVNRGDYFSIHRTNPIT